MGQITHYDLILFITISLYIFVWKKFFVKNGQNSNLFLNKLEIYFSIRCERNFYTDTQVNNFIYG